MMVFVGTYTTRGSVRSEGIYVYRMDPASGALKLDSVAKGVVNPSYLEIGPKQRYLFAVNEVGEFAGKPGGGVSAFSIDPKTARLTPLNQQPAHGAATCYVSIEQTGRFALVANYSKGNVIMLPILADGKLGPAGDIVQHHGASIDQGRQEAPRAHCIIPGPDNRYAFAADLGIDKIIIYRMDLEHGKLLPHGEAKAKPGAGPRHFTFHPNGRYAYLIQELNSTLTAFAYDAEKGSLEELQTLSTLPEDFKGRNHCADVHVSPSGKFVYGSNRGHDSIAMFAIDEKSGTLTSLGHEPTGGRTPRNFAIDPTGTYLLAANQDTSNIVTFRIDPQTGKLKKTDHATNVPFPVCVKIINFRKAQAGPSR
ncbi:MAG: lactonase family protein [Planctomycetes bacterium]|nr:lactonase family protein [Planctomycetota bacterium]